MADHACVAFLQWALPQLGLRWAGFRRVRRQVCRRIQARQRDLGLSWDSYRSYLVDQPDEWEHLEHLCRVTISRFWRNRRVFDALPELLRELASRQTPVAVWSAGCASGEEPYSVVLAAARVGVTVRVLATDRDPHLLERARAGRYPAGSLRELADVERAAFEREGELFVLKPALRAQVEFWQHDLRRDEPPSFGDVGAPFDLVLCRNLAFTYFDHDEQERIASRFAACCRPHGALIVGAHETVPPRLGFAPWEGLTATHRRLETRTTL